MTNTGLDQFSEDCFQAFLALIFELTGITIHAGRKTMVQGRLRKRALELKMPDYESYLELVRSSSSEKREFINSITTNETYFFRTPRIWDHLESVFLPKWHAENPGKTFRAWSAAASSGEEAHSLGVLCEEIRAKHPGFNYQILGTDISEEMVDLCRQGLYSGRSIEAFRKSKPELFRKYMQAAGERHQVLPAIRQRLKFEPHNLLRPLAKTDAFDLILLRNVLIYFRQPEQEKVLAHVHPLLAARGLLVIGESESLSHIKTDFHHLQPLVYSKGAPAGQQAA